MSKLLLTLVTLVFALQAIAEEKDALIVCDNGLEMFTWDLEFLSQAEHSVEALVCFFGGTIARRLLEAISARLEEVPTLQVHVLASPTMITPQNWKIIDSLCNRFPGNFHIEFSTQIAKLLPDIMTIDNHVKLFIVDETYYSAGGTNCEEHHCSKGTHTPLKKPTIEIEIDFMLPAGMRDQDVVGRGPIAAQLRTIFFQLYTQWEDYNKTKCLQEDPNQFNQNVHYFDVTGKRPYVERFEHSDRLRELGAENIRILLGGPHQPDNIITQEYVRLIQCAQEEIILSHLYFFPTKPIFQALMDAVKRGVKLTIVTNGLAADACEGAKLFVWANRISYVPMFYGTTFHFWDAQEVAAMPIGNTTVYEYCVPDVLLHKKTMLVDRRHFIVGSYNFGMKSAYGDYELILVIDSEKVAEDVLQVHLIDVAHSRQVSVQEACAWYFHPVISYWGELQKRFNGFM